MGKMKMATGVCLVLILAVFASGCSRFDPQRTAGEQENKAHDFTLPDQNGEMTTLSSVVQNHRGVLIAFYPKDGSKN